MPQTVLTGGQSGTLRRGLRDAFANAYDSVAEQIRTELAPVMDLGLPSDTDQEFYAYYESAPHPRYWPRGQNVAKSGFEAVQFSVTNRDWGREVEWHKNDEEDDQLTMLRNRAIEAGKNFALLDHRVFFQILEGTSDPELLPAIPNAPDGAALYATQDGDSNDRFGASGGNLITGTGVATSAAITADTFSAIEQFHLFQDTQGQQLLPPSVLDSGFIVYHGAARTQEFVEAFNQNPTTAAATTATSNAGVQNIFQAGGFNIELRPTQYISTDDYYLFLRGAPFKPIFEQTRLPLEEETFDEMNSKESARSLQRSVIFHRRSGYGVFLPWGTVKVNN